MNKYVAGAGVTVALLGGSLALTAVNPLSFAGAQDSTTSTEQVAPDAAPEEGTERVHPLQSALDELVAEGVITQEQADAVSQRTKSKMDEVRAEHPGRGGEHGGRGGHFGGIRESIDAIAGQLGMTTEELGQALAGGSSLNELAAEKGVDPAAVSQTIIDEANARIDSALAEGKITQEQADEAKSKVTENIDTIMDGSLPKGFGDRHGPGHDDDEAPADEAPAEDGGA